MYLILISILKNKRILFLLIILSKKIRVENILQNVSFNFIFRLKVIK